MAWNRTDAQAQCDSIRAVLEKEFQSETRRRSQRLRRQIWPEDRAIIEQEAASAPHFAYHDTDEAPPPLMIDIGNYCESPTGEPDACAE
jgi:hypothetical protein